MWLTAAIHMENNPYCSCKLTRVRSRRPYSGLVFRAVFSFSCGPLAWAIVLFRNSLVLHSLDMVTSVLVHGSPLIVVWTLRWCAVMMQTP